ncbi:unnamed protein product, partial [Allacma fusca]
MSSSSVISMVFFAFLSVDWTSGRSWYGGLMGLSNFCQDDGEQCTRHKSCCSGYCVDGACGQCKEAGEPCEAGYYHNCCGFCIDSVCKSCKDDGIQCSFSRECCSFYCIEGICGSCLPALRH